MALVSLYNDTLRCEIDPESGASITMLAMKLGGRWVPIMRPTPPEAIANRATSDMSCFVLLPYSNRIKDAEFRFEGESYKLQPNTPEGHTIHGDVRKRPWQVSESDPGCVRLRFESRTFPDINFPFPFNANLSYEIHESTFRVELELENSGTRRMPAGMGLHPYYSRTLLDPNEHPEVQARVSGEYVGLVPTTPAAPLQPKHDFSTMRTLEDVDVDACFAGWDGLATIRWPGSGVEAKLQAEPPFGHLILFTPQGKPYFALEPVSNANNGFNLFADGDAESGVRILEPGQTMAAAFRIELSAS